jgi:hypothetical protein
VRPPVHGSPHIGIAANAVGSDIQQLFVLAASQSLDEELNSVIRNEAKSPRKNTHIGGGGEPVGQSEDLQYSSERGCVHRRLAFSTEYVISRQTIKQ